MGLRMLPQRLQSIPRRPRCLGIATVLLRQPPQLDLRKKHNIDAIVDRFKIKVNVLSSDGDYSFLGSSMYLFEILDKNTPELAMLNSAGTIEPPSAGPVPDWIGRSRAFIHDDTVYYIRDDDVWAAFWHSPGVVNGPF